MRNTPTNLDNIPLDVFEIIMKNILKSDRLKTAPINQDYLNLRLVSKTIKDMTECVKPFNFNFEILQNEFKTLNQRLIDIYHQQTNHLDDSNHLVPALNLITFNNKLGRNTRWYSNLNNPYKQKIATDLLLIGGLVVFLLINLYRHIISMLNNEDFHIRNQLIKNPAAIDNFLVTCNATHQNKDELIMCENLLEKAYDVMPDIILNMLYMYMLVLLDGLACFLLFIKYRHETPIKGTVAELSAEDAGIVMDLYPKQTSIMRFISITDNMPPRAYEVSWHLIDNLPINSNTSGLNETLSLMRDASYLSSQRQFTIWANNVKKHSEKHNERLSKNISKLHTP